jgi:hypothetical protein
MAETDCVATPSDPDEARRASSDVDPESTDPRAKEAALNRLRDAPDEELALFESKLREDALRAGATEQEVREAQAGRPEHGRRNE